MEWRMFVAKGIDLPLKHCWAAKKRIGMDEQNQMDVSGVEALRLT